MDFNIWIISPHTCSFHLASQFMKVRLRSMSPLLIITETFPTHVCLSSQCVTAWVVYRGDCVCNRTLFHNFLDFKILVAQLLPGWMGGWMDGQMEVHRGLLRTYLCVFIIPEAWWSHKTHVTGRVCVHKWETGRRDNNIAPNLGSVLYRLERHLFCSLCMQINIPCLIFAFFHHTNLVSIHTVPCWTYGIYGKGGAGISSCASPLMRNTCNR